MSHDHHDDKIPEYKEIIPFALIACAVFAYLSTIVGQNGLAGKASAELEHHTGFEQVAIAFKGKQAVLSGNVANAAQKEEAEEIVAEVEGVSGIKSNDIEIGLQPDPEPVSVASKDTPEPAHHDITISPAEDKKSHASAGINHKGDEHAIAAVHTAPQGHEVAPEHHNAPHDDHAHAEVAAAAAANDNPFVAVLAADSNRVLEIVATVTGPTTDLKALNAANQKLATLKEEITSGGNVSAKRVRTVLEAAFSSEHTRSETAFSYIVE